MMNSLWLHILTLGDQYGVNPFVFGVLYLVHHPLFWGTMACLAARVRQKRPVTGVVALGVFFWLLPYGYVFLFGHGLPWWAYAVAVVFVAVGGTQMAREIRRPLVAKEPITPT